MRIYIIQISEIIISTSSTFGSETRFWIHDCHHHKLTLYSTVDWRGVLSPSALALEKKNTQNSGEKIKKLCRVEGRGVQKDRESRFPFA